MPSIISVLKPAVELVIPLFRTDETAGLKFTVLFVTDKKAKTGFKLVYNKVKVKKAEQASKDLYKLDLKSVPKMYKPLIYNCLYFG